MKRLTNVARWDLGTFYILTHPLDKIATILQTRFSDAFSWMASFVFWLKFHWSLFLRVQLAITQHWFRQWLGAEQVTSHYLNQCWPDSLTHVCGTRGRWVNSKFHFNDPEKKLSEFESKHKQFLRKKYHWKYCLQSGGHFVMSQYGKKIITFHRVLWTLTKETVLIWNEDLHDKEVLLPKIGHNQTLLVI